MAYNPYTGRWEMDGGGPEAKIAGYYHGIVEPRLERD